MASQHRRDPVDGRPSAPGTTLSRWWFRRFRALPPTPFPVVALLVVALLVDGCSAGPVGWSGGPAGQPVATPQESVPRPNDIMIVVFENKDYEHIVGASDAPYLTSLAHQGANLTDAHAETHPSQPNYLALLSGSTQGVTDDSCPQDLGDRATLASQLAGAGLSFAGFSENLPAPAYTGCASPDGLYARKHNPWVDVRSTPPGANLPFSQLPTDPGALPTVSVVVPNLCNDMHNCPVATGDDWARTHLSGYLDWAASHNSLLMITFDEDDDSPANHIPTILVGPMVRPGDLTVRTNHYSLLRTIEDMYALPPLGAAGTTPPLTGIWRR